MFELNSFEQVLVYLLCMLVLAVVLLYSIKRSDNKRETIYSDFKDTINKNHTQVTSILETHHEKLTDIENRLNT